MFRFVARLGGALLFLLCFSPCALSHWSEPDQEAEVEIVSSAAQIPEWAQQGKFRFARLDGGPLEPLKAARSSWGKHFTDHQREVLGSLYSANRDRVIELLSQANVNWVWITWSVGYSWQDEAIQREQCKLITAALHKRGIRVAAYLCAFSMFWESMFRDDPRSVRWILLDHEGIPHRYSGGHDALRFIADISNPEWLEYQKRRIGAAIDAGVDAIFMDNTAVTRWASDEIMEDFVGKICRFIRQERRSNILLLGNWGLAPDRVVFTHNMDVVFNEHWVEPGVWDAEWDASNVRRMKYLRGVVPQWKPLISEYSNFHSGSRLTGWLKPKSVKLGIAEAAAFQSGYAWDMEGPFVAALLSGDPAALESWKAIGEYNGFLRDHEDLYWKTRGTARIAALISEKQQPSGSGISFGWDREDTGLYDFLSKNSVLCDIRLLRVLNKGDLRAYSGIVLPASVEVTPSEAEMLRGYKAGGGKIYVLGDAISRAPLATVSSSDAVFDSLRSSESSQREVLNKIRELTQESFSLVVEGAPHTLGNMTRLPFDKGLVIHLLNYAPVTVQKVRLRITFPRALVRLASTQPRLLTPDAETRGISVLPQRAHNVIELTLQTLDNYAVVVLQ